ncbi:MAG: AMP-binding protein, partial [Haliea sp.]|nr:AMP-binding protein [Haliea sp.]
MSSAKNGSLPLCSSYEALCEQFSWSIPEMFNIADAICDRWASDEQRVAITFEDTHKKLHQITYRSLQRDANRLANLFASLGIARGDRVTVCLPQRPECAISHIACFKSGIVSCLASVLFGEEALKHRINGSRSKLCIVDADNYAKIESIFDDCPSLEYIVVVGEVDADLPLGFYSATRDLSDEWVNVATRAEEPAWINYTSGTTGLPKGVVMPHRAVLGNVSIFEYLFDYFPQSGDVLWSQADWAWVAGFADIFLVGTFHGRRIVSTSMKGFDPVEAFRILSDHNVTVSLLTPTMLKLMREASARVETDKVQLRVVLS